MLKYGLTFKEAIDLAISIATKEDDKVAAGVTIYFNSEDGSKHAAYDVTSLTLGSMFIDGHIVTVADLPPSVFMKSGQPVTPTTFAFSTCIAVAEEVFKYHLIDISAGWNIKP